MEYEYYGEGLNDFWDINEEPEVFPCLYCDEEFPTLGTEERHVDRMHPEESRLHCPVCRHGGFRMPSELMGHIERGDCTMTLRQLNQRRQRQAAYRRQLEKPGRSKNNFERFMDIRSPSSTQNVTSSRASSHASTVQDRPRGVSTISASESLALRPMSTSGSVSVRDVRSDGSANSNLWQTHSETSHATSTSFAGTHIIDVLDDLREGVFDPRQYIDQYSGKYHCPVDPCPKIFKTGDALKGHLRSSAHSNVRYTCPQCHSQLHTLEGMTAHAQDVRSKCGISRKDTFGPYMEQLTAGLIDVIFVGRKKRVKYETNQAAEAEFSNGPKIQDEK